MLPTALSSSILYAPGVFFCYPWKPLLLLVEGDPYESGYRFFRRDHSDATNLALHFVALGWQLLGNFGVLAALDEAALRAYPALGVVPRPISAVTGALWALQLLASPAPLVCSVLSTACIGAAYVGAQHVTARELELGAMGTFVGVLLLASLLLARKVNAKAPLLGTAKDVARALAWFGLATAVTQAAGTRAGAYAAEARQANAALALLMCVLGALPKPTVPAVLGGIFVVRAVGVLTSQEPLLFLGAAFAAQVSQGVAHDVSRQQATLLSHEKDASHGRATKLQFEWSHAVYFPNLLLHSAYDSITSSTASSRRKAR